MQKKWLYFFVIVCSAAGVAWVAWNSVYYIPADPHSGFGLCLFRRVTGLPCPSCGSTRSVVDISRMNFVGALYDNPFGYLLVLAMVVCPFWVLYDMAMRRSSFYDFYLAFNSFGKKRWVTISLILIVAANWIWNIYKFT